MIKNNDELRAEEAMRALLAKVNQSKPVRALQQLDRRQFIAGALSAGVLVALSGCAPSNATDKAANNAAATVLKAGSYTAEGQGRNGIITVTATFDDSKLLSIEAEQMESRNIGDFAIESLSEKYISSQSLNVDAVSGATLTSLGLATALSNCWEQAGGNVQELLSKPSGIEPAPAINESADVVVVGSGGSALAAAVTAAEAGAKVIVLEKMDIVGGNTNAGEGTFNSPDPARQEPLGIEDSSEKFYEDTFVGGDSAGDPELVRVLANNALDGVHWMEAHGLKFNDEVFTAIGGLWQRGHSVAVEKMGEQGGSYYVSCLRDSLLALGGTIYTDAKVEALVQEGDAVVGVTGTRPSSGATIKVDARSVVVATGGYARNAELAMEFDKRVTPTMPTSNVASSTGDGLVFARAAGAGVRNMETVQIHPLGDPQNGGVATFVGNWLGVEDYVFVNDEGLRFIREDERRDTIANAILDQTNDQMWLMVDSTNVTPDRLEQIDDLVAKGHSYTATSVAELASQIGVPADALGATIESYNAATVAGVDEAQGKLLLGDAFDTAPLFASKRIPTIHYCMGGLTITPEAKVTKQDGTVIPGLYAAGEVTGGVQGGNRLGGNSFPDLIVFGRVAGASAVANI
ncbi:MAG: flavocytochrome c [Coriobacteriales bacterium]|jgi:fumarate reductase flavoprotein subunit|nr:flavocytochrome c [Coriobacteriales bacterium]